MLDSLRISDELWDMADEKPDTILNRAVQRIHEAGSPYDWVGIYLVAGGHLILHSFIGRSTELTRIPIGQGVSGRAVAEDRDLNVPDVETFESYLARCSETGSEVVVLIRFEDRVLGVIDVDSDSSAAFGDEDELGLRAIADALGETLGLRLRPPGASSGTT